MPLFDLFAGTLDGVFAVDKRQRIAFWNDGARRILGIEAGSVLGRPCHEVIGGTDENGCAVCEKGCATFRASLRGELSTTKDVLVRAGDGARKRINVTTFVLPSQFRELSLLAHVFREKQPANAAMSLMEQALGDAAAGGVRDGLPHPVARLTPTESKILRLLACGASTDVIGSRLDVRMTTVRTHVQHIMEKLGVHTRLEAVACGARSGLLHLDEAGAGAAEADH